MRADDFGMRGWGIASSARQMSRADRVALTRSFLRAGRGLLLALGLLYGLGLAVFGSFLGVLERTGSQGYALAALLAGFAAYVAAVLGGLALVRRVRERRGRIRSERSS